MDCNHCGKYYPNEERRCPYCGYKMTREERKAAEISRRERQQNVNRERTPEQQREMEKHRWEENRAWLREKSDIRPVEAVLLSTQGESLFKRTMKAGLVFGQLGAFIAAATAENAQPKTAAFRVWYENGRTEEVTVRIGSEEYKKLIKLTRDE